MVHIQKNLTISKLSLYLFLIFMATAIVRFYGIFVMCPPFIKTIFSICIYTSFFLFPYSIIKTSSQKLYRTGNLLLMILVLFIGIGLVQGLLYQGIIIGNKYITLFLNETAWMILLPPLFTFLILKDNIWQKMYKLFFIYAICAILCLLIGKSRVACAVIPVIPIFFYYCKDFK